MLTPSSAAVKGHKMNDPVSESRAASPSSSTLRIAAVQALPNLSRAVRAPEEPQFGSILRRLRITAGLSQAKLAELADPITLSAISALESGRRRFPHPYTLKRLGDALNASDEDRAAMLAAASRIRSRP